MKGIQQLRELKKITRATMSKDLRISQSNYQRFEEKVERASFRQLKAIRLRLGIPLDEFYALLERLNS